jgi:hypothetical protein
VDVIAALRNGTNWQNVMTVNEVQITVKLVEREKSRPIALVIPGLSRDKVLLQVLHDSAPSATWSSRACGRSTRIRNNTPIIIAIIQRSWCCQARGWVRE